MSQLPIPILEVRRLDSHAKIPTKGSDYAAGYDLYALNDVTIPAKGKRIVKTGVAMRIPRIQFPYAVYGSIRSRSGLSVKHGIEVGAGVIDCDYSDEVRVILHNHGEGVYFVEAGDRIAQLVLEVHLLTDVKEVKELSDIDTNRTGGFGSTGK
jgi:dUTP pyrophosphatase